MALQSGIGISKIIILCGVGYSTTFLIQNGKLSDLIGEIQSIVKGIENPGEKSHSDVDYSDAIGIQVRRLAMEVRKLASTQQITVLNGNSSQFGNISPFILPAATIGVLGYGYMWWKGFKFSDLMYVTKRNMANAVSNLTKHLETVSEALSATKRHLTQRIEGLDAKLDDQKEISKLIKNEVADVHSDLSQIGFDLGALQKMVSGLDGKICTLEDKQDIANMGVMYLCDFVDGRKTKVPQLLQEKLKLSGRSCGLLTSSETPSFKGLKSIFEESTTNRFLPYASNTTTNDKNTTTDGMIMKSIKLLN